MMTQTDIQTKFTVFAARKFTLILVAIFALMPFSALADESNTIVGLSSNDRIYLWIAFGFGAISIITGLLIRLQVLKALPGSEKMQEVGKAIREGALAYLKKQVGTMIWFVVAIAIGLFFLFFKAYGVGVAVAVSGCFVAGVFSSYLAGFTGMLMAVDANMRTANAALTSYKKSLVIAFRSGAVTGLMTVGLGLVGATLIFLIAGSNAMRLLVGYGFGSSLAALFMRVGGGIFTKAADVGADLVGKVEAGIPEDDPRNPAVIADNVGDNVGDCAGMAADVFESYAVTLVAAIVLGAATATVFDGLVWMKLVIFAFMISGVGIIASICGIFAVSGSEDLKISPIRLIRRGFYTAAIVAAICIAVVSVILFGKSGPVPFHSISLKSTAQVSKDEFDSILRARHEIALKNHEEDYQVANSDLPKAPEIIALNFPPDSLAKLTQDAVNFREDQTPRIPDLANFRIVDPTITDDPVLNYTVELPPTIGGPPVPETLKNVFFPAGTATEFDVFDLTLTSLVGTNGQAPLPPKNIVVGPMELSQMTQLIAQANASGKAKIVTNHQYRARLYENPRNGRLVMGIEGDIEPDTLGPIPIQYSQTAPDVFQKISQDQVAVAAGKVPIMETTGLAIVETHNIPFYFMLAPVLFGILLAFGIEKLTDYYVSTSQRPVKEVANVSSAGAAPMIIQGFSYALESSVFMVLAIVIALLIPLWIFPPSVFGTYILSFYGVALVGLGLLATTGFILAMDTFGPISDNAQGVFEMSKESENSAYGMQVVSQLDAAGNTTKALTKGFAITTAVIAAVALFHSFLQDANLSQIGLRLDYPEIFLGLLIGGAAPYLFSAFSINAVGRAAFQLIHEVRRQFHASPEIMKGTQKPDYGVCVRIVTAAAQRELLSPGILAICLPIAVGFGFSIGKPPVEIGGHYFNLAGVQVLGGFLAGAIISGQLMAVLLANSGGLWDNAKKVIEDGLMGGKGSEAHKASVICDTVGDPFKDTAGPALNPLIKVMNLVSLLLAPTFILPLGDKTLTLITAINVLALVAAVVISKKGSLSEGFQKAAHESEVQAPIVQSKKKILVDDDLDTKEPSSPHGLK